MGFIFLAGCSNDRLAIPEMGNQSVNLGLNQIEDETVEMTIKAKDIETEPAVDIEKEARSSTERDIKNETNKERSSEKTSEAETLVQLIAEEYLNDVEFRNPAIWEHVAGLSNK